MCLLLSHSAFCGSALTSGTLTSAAYQQSFSYDALGRLASVSTAGTYAYGDATHPHAATQITDSQSNQVWVAAYDVAGNLTCRAPNATTTCGGTPTGQTLAYDNAGQLTQWSSAPQ